MPNQSRLWWYLHDADEPDALYVMPKIRIDREARWQLVRGERPPVEPVIYIQHLGTVPMDLVSTTTPGRFLVSNQFIEVLRKGNFTGWATYPVQVLTDERSPKEILGYHGLSITGRGGQIDKSRRQITTEGKWGTWRGLYFNETQWDGSDIFVLGVVVFICVTQHVYETLSIGHLRNVRLTRCDEVTRKFLLKKGDEIDHSS